MAEQKPSEAPFLSQTNIRGGAATPKRTASRAGGSTSKKAKLVVGKGRAKKSKDDIWDDVDTILGDGNSPLYKYETNIPEILQHGYAQPILESEDATAKLSELSTEDLKRTVVDFKNDGRMGFHDPEYLSQAVTASVRRMNGEFEAYIQHQFNETWYDLDSDREYSDDENASSKPMKSVENSEKDCKDLNGDVDIDELPAGHFSSTKDHHPDDQEMKDVDKTNSAESGAQDTQNDKAPGYENDWRSPTQNGSIGGSDD